MAIEKAGVEITAIDSATRVFNQIVAGGKAVEKTFDGIKSSVEGFAAAFAVDKIVEETIRWEQASFRLNATLKATGNAVGLTRKELDDLAQSLERTTPFDLTDLRQAEANLVKFGNIHEDVFKEALKLSADYAAFTGSTVAEASQKLGRALQDPVAGLRTLREVIGNLSFTEKERIAQLEASGNTQEAQIVLIEKLKTAIGGTGSAANAGLTGSVGLLRKIWDEVGEAAAHAVSSIENGIAAAAAAMDKSGLGNAASRFVGPPAPPPPPSWEEAFAQQNARLASSMAQVVEQQDRQREAAAKAAPVVAQWTNLLKDQTNEQRALDFVLEGQGRTLADLYKVKILNVAVELDWRRVQKENMDLAARYAKALQDETLSEEENLSTRVQTYESAWLVGTRRVFQDYIAHAKDGAEQAQFFFSRAFQNMEDALVDFAMTGKFKFADFARSVEADLLRIIARQAIAFGASQAGVSGFLGGLFGSGTFADTAAVSVHSGGVIGAGGGMPRSVDSRVFIGAPRMHSGGLAGDEVPAILQRGERVIPRGGSAMPGLVQHFHIGGNVTRADLAAVAQAGRDSAIAFVAEARRRNPTGPFGG
jgi:lambda family phage tail tape measure protein